MMVRVTNRVSLCLLLDLVGAMFDLQVVDVSPGANFTYDWMHLWPLEVQAGDPVWISFHSRDPLYDSATTVAVRVLSSNGQTVLEGLPPCIHAWLPCLFDCIKT